MTFLFVHERENCIGCCACTSLDSKNWVMAPDGKSHLIKSIALGDKERKEFPKEDLEKNKEVALCCPVNIIHIYEDNKPLI